MPHPGPEGCIHEYQVRIYADIYPVPEGDGAVEEFDIMCILDAANGLNTFGCTTVLPSGYMVGDIYPCGSPDGVVEGFDILAVLDTANGIYWCPHPCPPLR